jgi:hypothetical protein
MLSTSLYATDKTKSVYSEDYEADLNKSLETDAGKNLSASSTKTRH